MHANHLTTNYHQLYIMNEFTINVNHIEELQTICNTNEIKKILNKAKTVVIQGGSVLLTRTNADGSFYRFDEITTEDDIAKYKASVLKYL